MGKGGGKKAGLRCLHGKEDTAGLPQEVIEREKEPVEGQWTSVKATYSTKY